MDIAGLSMSLNQIKLQSDVSVAVLAKSMDVGEAMGAGIVEMIDKAAMEQSVAPHIGGNFDMTV